MKRKFCAGVFALAAIVLLSEIPAASASEFASGGYEQSQNTASVDVVRIKNVLRLTPRQEVYWPPVEAALRGIAHHQARSEPEGFMRRISHRVISIVLNSAAVERLAVASRPLLAVLDDDQKRAASGLAQEMGLGPVVMAALR
jgi:hypothetical protein